MLGLNLLVMAICDSPVFVVVEGEDRMVGKAFDLQT